MTSTRPAEEVRDRLRDPAWPHRLVELGFRDDDVVDALTAAATVADSDDDLASVAVLADRVRRRIGNFAPETDDVWAGPEAKSAAVPGGVLPMLTLMITAPEVAAFHARRGISSEVSTATLADLGQQVRVHRQTYGGFGLHTQGWLALVWSGALYALGRLQFNLQRDVGDHWVLSTHIPATGPLTPGEVDASFAAATGFFATHFPDYPTTHFFCDSWLLDPRLPELAPGSNLAAFQRRWTLDDTTRSGVADLLFFVFGRRDEVDPAELPTDTSLRRVLAAHLRAGHGWTTRTGRITPTD